MVTFPAAQFEVDVPDAPPATTGDRGNGGGGERAAPVGDEGSSDPSTVLPLVLAVLAVGLAVAGAVALGLRRRPPSESAA
jgi:hypothetical protein